jgi:AraC-like DNA-binding protein
MRTEIHIGLFDAFIFLGVFQGILISWFFIKNVQNSRHANLFQGLFLLSVSLAIFEEWLNNTGYIVKVLYLTNFTEPVNFAIGPLFYFYIRRNLFPDDRGKTWIHFLLFLFWVFYMVFSHIQSDEFKYNSYIETKHPDWGYLDFNMKISDDPLGVGNYANELFLVQLIAYLVASICTIRKKTALLGESFFRTGNEQIVVVRNSFIHLTVIIVLLVGTKIYFGMGSDVGGYLVAAYVSFMIYATSYQILNKSDFFNKPSSFFPFPTLKYQKSSLSEEDKEVILQKIKKEMEKNHYFTNNLASLSGLAKQINESSHHVSQVINEKMDKSFFELLAFYRVEYAMELIRKDKNGKLTVEELAERVGYNSKSSFNMAFKKFASQTPSEYRKSVDVG